MFIIFFNRIVHQDIHALAAVYILAFVKNAIVMVMRQNVILNMVRVLIVNITLKAINAIDVDLDLLVTLHVVHHLIVNVHLRKI